MTYFVQNTVNALDPIHYQPPFATQEEAEAAARQIVAATPNAIVRVGCLLKVFRANVTVLEESPEDSSALPLSE